MTPRNLDATVVMNRIGYRCRVLAIAGQLREADAIACRIFSRRETARGAEEMMNSLTQRTANGGAGPGRVGGKWVVPGVLGKRWAERRRPLDRSGGPRMISYPID